MSRAAFLRASTCSGVRHTRERKCEPICSESSQMSLPLAGTEVAAATAAVVPAEGAAEGLAVDPVVAGWEAQAASNIAAPQVISNLVMGISPIYTGCYVDPDQG